MSDRLGRRRLLRTGLVATLAGIAGCGDGTTEEPSPGGEPTDGGDQSDTVTSETPSPTATPVPEDTVALETVATGFAGPVGFADPPTGDDDLYVLDQYGEATVVGGDGVREVVLDVGDRMVDLRGYDERGLLGVAFHPEFETNRRVFVRYSAPPRERTPDDYSHTFVLAEFEAAEDGRSFDPDSERSILEIPEPQLNHNAGAITFGPDGYLYVAVGDGGGAGDAGFGHAEDWYDGNSGSNGQDVTENLLGGVLRIDVDDADGDRPYGIPDDNPLVGEEGLDEYYAWGLRNPWRMSFDDGRLIVADVGQDRYEEVNVVEKGGNYGWNVKEGTHCYLAASCPDETPDGEPLIDPVVEYPHEDAEISGRCVIGGYVYRGTSVPELRGDYVFGDWQADGELFAATPTESGQWPVRTIDLLPEDRTKLAQLLSFGRDGDGELYVLGVDEDGDGAVYRIDSPD